MFEGIPSWPDWNRWWNIIDKHQVNIFYTAPTAIRAFEAHSMEMFRNTSLQSLRILGTVGEPINEEAWHWYFKNVGRENCSITDTWWQTETGGICIAPLAGITPVIPSFATLPLPGIEPVVVDAEGKIITTSKAEGSLCLGRSWPGQARTIYGDHNRFQKTYFSTYAGLYFTGDGCKRNENGYYRITGRIDDVIKVSGHRLGTAEIENVINSTEHVIESAVVPVPHAIKGECLYAFVIVDAGFPAAEMEQHICHSVAHLIGPIARPEKVFVVTALPKTRSGKIMRRILRKLAAGEWDQLGDTSTLLNPESAGEIIHLMKSKMQFQE
jgi:acetyl-CoA synthetase